MAAEMVKSATSERLKDLDWTKNIEICELVAKEQGQAKAVIKSIKKRLGHKNANTQLFAIRLLEMLMTNCGEHIHRQVIDNGLLPILVKIVKKKTDFPVRERIFLLLDVTQTALGGSEGKFPQYYAAYYDLVASRVQFPQHQIIPSTQSSQSKDTMEVAKEIPAEEPQSNICQIAAKQSSSEGLPDHSIIHKATCVMEVLREVLNALAPKRPEGAADEFILDLVEQCSFQKQQIMHLILSCHDEKLMAQAIELNEQLDEVLAHHDSLLNFQVTSIKASFGNEATAEEENEESLFRRIRKGKARAEDNSDTLASSFRSISNNDLRRPLLRPLCIQPMDHDSRLHPPHPLAGSIPPPPAKYMERQRFFKERHSNGSGLSGHMRGLSLQSCNGSRSRSGSTDFSDTGGIHD